MSTPPAPPRSCRGQALGYLCEGRTICRLNVCGAVFKSVTSPVMYTAPLEALQSVVCQHLFPLLRGILPAFEHAVPLQLGNPVYLLHQKKIDVSVHPLARQRVGRLELSRKRGKHFQNDPRNAIYAACSRGRKAESDRTRTIGAREESWRDS